MKEKIQKVSNVLGALFLLACLYYGLYMFFVNVSLKFIELIERMKVRAALRQCAFEDDCVEDEDYEYDDDFDYRSIFERHSSSKEE